MAELLTGQALAVALDDAGLAPPGATEYIGADGRSRHEWWLSSDRPHGGEFWQPWCCLCCVAHLFSTFHITINWMYYPSRPAGAWCWSIGQQQRWWVNYITLDPGEEHQFAMAIGNVALRCATQQKDGKP